MIDFEKLGKLHAAANSIEDTPERAEARQVVSEIIDDTITEYLSLPENAWPYGNGYGRKKGDPWWSNFADLARDVSFSLDQNPDEPNPEFCERRSGLEKDRLGIILRHRKIQQAKAAPVACDCDYVVISGDTYHLGVRWCISKPPHEPKEIKL